MTRFEAHSSEDILILLDTTPDQSMLDEGVAREVVNRIQKLRKKAGLAPTDEVTVHCHVQPAGHDLARVISGHRYINENFILTCPGLFWILFWKINSELESAAIEILPELCL